MVALMNSREVLCENDFIAGQSYHCQEAVEQYKACLSFSSCVSGRVLVLHNVPEQDSDGVE